jgi:DNA-binding beta-propeller fold protein YncE
LGVIVLTKWRKTDASLWSSLGALALLALAGCGGGGGTSNVVTVHVTLSTSLPVIVSQSITATATVTGSTNTDISAWACTYFTTSVDTTGKPTAGTDQPCTAETGTIPSGSTGATVTYTAPSKVPNPTTIAGTNCASASQTCLFNIRLTATAAADTKKTGNATFFLDSGIAVGLTPTTATVPTNERQQFNATLSNDLDPQNQGVNWLLTQTTPTGSQTFPSLPTCSPGCGQFLSTTANVAVYEAPTTLPTTATLTLVASSKADATRLALGTITIIQGGPIQFNTISPTIAPQGAAFYNIFLDAPFISSASTITLTKQSDNTQTVINSSSNQVKVVFPIPSTSNANPASTGARLTLNAANLSAADTYTVSVSDPGQTVTTCTGTPLPSGCKGQGNFSFQVRPVRPTSVASIPDSIQQGSTNETNLAVDGGYFGANGALANTVFNGTTLPQNQDSASNSRQLNLSFPAGAANSALPGLYPLSVNRTTPPLPAANNPSVTDIAIFPDYSANFPAVVGAPVPAGQKPSAVDIDYTLGILAVAETASNQVEFFQIGQNSLTPIACPAGASCAVTAPTGLSINQSNHTAAVVSPQDNEVVVLKLPCPAGVTCGDPQVTYPLHISLAGLLPGAVSPLPLPYAVGVDSDTNMGLVAYSSSANPTLAKVGFLLDLNADGQTCLKSGDTPPCVFAQVTLNTGTYPQIAMVPHSHQALVTPGGAGVISGIDVTKPSSQLPITNVNLTSGLVTVTVKLDANQTLGINPGNPGTVLIQDVPNGKENGVVFNGVFTVQSVLNANTFTYALNAANNDSVDPTQCDPSCGTVSFSSPNIVVGISQTSQGISINPITRTAAIADANATGSNGPQINLLNALDQNVGSITFRAGCAANNTTQAPCTGAPELLGTTSVAFQPYTNSLISYNPNPAQNSLQRDQVSISNPVSLQRQTFVKDPSDPSNTDPSLNFFLSGTGSSSICIPNTNPCQSGSPTLTLFGGLAVDRATNQAFVVQSGSNQIRIINLQVNPSDNTRTLLKPVQITELQVPTVPGALIGGIKGALMSQGTLTCVNAANPAACDLPNVLITGSGFDSSPQVRLDGTAIPSGNVNRITDRLLSVRIPGSFLSSPHRYAVDVKNNSNNVVSNATDFLVITAVDLSKTAASPVCRDSSGNGLDAQPNSVAIADQLPGQGFSPIAVVTNSGCGSVSIINIDPNSSGFGTLTAAKSIPTGTGPMGVAVSQRYGLAIVSNNTDGTVSVLDLVAGTQKVPAVTVGSEPMGVAISDDTGVALVANSGNSTVSRIDLSLLFPQPGSTATPATSLSATTIGVDQSPIAVAIDPDRGTNNRGLAVVTALQLVSGGVSVGVLDAVDIGGTTPAKATTGAVGGNVTATPTGIVFDPSVSPKLFYASSSGGNVVTAFNPDTGATSSVRVGINPTSLALNPQTGGIMTINFTGQTVSIIDTISSPFTTRRTFGLGGSAQFGIAIDQFTNLAVLADQANNRVLIFPVPN